MEEFFVGPAAQERGCVGVFDGACGKNTAQVHDRVRFNVHHVREAPDLILGQRILTGLGQINVADIYLFRVS
jgi:hypothetical protein